MATISIDSNTSGGFGLISSLLFTLIGMVTDAPVWLKIVALVMGSLVGLVTIVITIWRFVLEYKKLKGK